MGFALDSEGLAVAEPNLEALVSELSNLIPEILDALANAGRDPVREFGAQCANTHIAVLNFIKENYAALCPNLTIGEFGIDSETLYSFSRNKFKEWLITPPEIVECHTWITLGSESIIDCTGPTYLQTRVNSLSSLGGIAYGKAGNLAFAAIQTSNYSHSNVGTRGLRYLPIAVGAAALHAIAPKFDS